MSSLLYLLSLTKLNTTDIGLPICWDQGCRENPWEMLYMGAWGGWMWKQWPLTFYSLKLTARAIQDWHEQNIYTGANNVAFVFVWWVGGVNKSAIFIYRPGNVWKYACPKLVKSFRAASLTLIRRLRFYFQGYPEARQLEVLFFLLLMKEIRIWDPIKWNLIKVALKNPKFQFASLV
jgi:hypothetical protein